MRHNGFTLVELLLTLSIIVSLSIITLPYFHSMTYSIDIDQFKTQITSFVSQAKSHSLVFHKDTHIQFSNTSIRIYENDFEREYHLPEQCNITTPKTVYFNNNGNINRATHIDFKCNKNNLRLNIHLGNGDVCFET